MTNPIHFEGSDLLLSPEDFTPQQLEHLLSIGGPGQQDTNVADFRDLYEVTGDPESCRLYLKGYGAWDEEELADHESNLARLIWLTGGAFCDGEVAYFSAY